MSLKIVKDPRTGKKQYKVRVPGQQEWLVFDDIDDQDDQDDQDDLDRYLDEDEDEQEEQEEQGDDIFVKPAPAKPSKRPLSPAPMGDKVCDLNRNRIKLPKQLDLPGVSEQQVVTCSEQSLRMATWRALQPFYAFVGKCEAMLGGNDVRRHYRWLGQGATLKERQTPVVSGNTTLTEFWENNMHLGPQLLAASIASSAATYITEQTRGEREGNAIKRKKSLPPLPRPRVRPVAPQTDSDDFDWEQQTAPSEEITPSDDGGESGLSFLDDSDDEGTSLAKAFSRIESAAMGNCQPLFRLGHSVHRNTLHVRRIGEDAGDLSRLDMNAVVYLPIEQAESDILSALVGDEQALLHPDWVLSVIHKSSFQFMLQHTSFGAFELAASELSRLKNFRFVKPHDILIDLILSDSVSDMFAEFVANKFLTASGGNAYPSTIGNNGFNARYNVSAGFRTRAERSRWNMGAKMWFNYVSYVPNRTVSVDTKDMEEERDSYLSLKAMSVARYARNLRDLRIRMQNLNSPYNEDPATLLPVISDNFRLMAEGGEADRGRRTAMQDVLKVLRESVQLRRNLLLYEQNIRKKKMQIAKIRRQRQSHRPKKFVYRK